MFPKSFVWGAASSAYQIEGAASTDGRKPSVWDTFCQRPGAVFNGHTGEVACDHYHRYRDDVALMKSIGLQAYRFSISWSRVLPEGIGAPNEKGLEFYDRLVDALLEANIQPWATLFHWDFPEALMPRGGWLARESADWFAEFATLMGKRLGDRVKHWMTLNEPQVYLALGHMDAKHAPGLKLTFAEGLKAAHHTLLAHGRGVQALRAAVPGKAIIGWAPVGHVSCAATTDDRDIEAARRAMFAVKRKDFWNNTWFADPVCLGHYPADGLELYKEELPPILDGDMKTICQPLDFYGVNIYSGGTVKADADGNPVDVPAPTGAPVTTFRWLVTPESLYWGPKLLAERYRLPVAVTENGMANTDWPDMEGKVADPQRIDFTRRYLLKLGQAAKEGVDIRAYFHWSILDNFEWAEGYRERFGMTYVDYTTLKRTPKASAEWYSRVIKSNGANLAPGAAANAGGNGVHTVIRNGIATAGINS